MRQQSRAGGLMIAGILSIPLYAAILFLIF